MTEDQIRSLLDQAKEAYIKGVSDENVGLMIWTRRVQTAMWFIPKLMKVVTYLLREQDVQGGRVETVDRDGVENKEVCHSCGAHLGTARSADLRPAGQHG